ncbi:MAG: radical SAM protein [Proteobacteria bacterium]|nr:radical SAM protein [Pseudomonadota bacterium]
MKISEIFTSIQGETSFVGLQFTFVRLTGCNLRCSYCDTQYAYEEGTEYSLDTVVAEVNKRAVPRVVITGGEPLLQDETCILCSRLLDAGVTVLLETNGSILIKDVDQRVHRILDMKCPGSGMDKYMNLQNIDYLTVRDEIKFVISDRKDFEWALEILKQHEMQGRAHVLFSPVSDRLHPQELAEWILQEKLNVRLQLQIHRYIWPDRRRGV